MDNITTLDPLPTEISKTILPYILEVNNPASLDISNSTQVNWPTDGSVKYEPSRAALWTYLAVRLLSGGLAIFGNSLTIFAVTKFEQLQTCSNYLICSLAVSDLLSGLMVPLIPVYELYHNSWFFIPVCLVQQTLALISLGGNLLNILYLSIDRYIYIAFPLRYNGLVTPQRLVIILTITWINCLIVTPTIVFTRNHLQVGMPCRSQIFLNDWVMDVYFVPQVSLTMLLTVGFHLAIAKNAHNQARKIQAQLQPYDTMAVAINQSTKKISRTLGLVLGVYLFSILPQLLMGAITSNNLPLEFIERYTVALHRTNAWLNPLIYAWRFKDFKITFKKIFTGTGSFNEVPGINV